MKNSNNQEHTPTWTPTFNRSHCSEDNNSTPTPLSCSFHHCSSGKAEIITLTVAQQ